MPFDSIPESPVVQHLRSAKSRVQDPANWWQYGRHMGDSDQHYCARLAVTTDDEGRFFDDDLPWEAALPALRQAAINMGFNDEIHLNDTTDHQTVMKLFDRAIAEQKARELAGAETGR